MTDHDAAIRDLTDRLAAAQRARMRAEAERDAADAQAERARAQLHTEFGVSTVADAQKKLAALNAELADELAKLSATLDQTGV